MVIRSMIAAIVGVVAASCVAGAAFAGNQGSSLSLVVLPSTTASVTASASTEASYGGQITFNVSTTQSDLPFVNVRCYQGDAFVYDAWHGFFAEYYEAPVYTLASDYWTGGAATCTARLVYWGKSGRARTLATTTFLVLP